MTDALDWLRAELAADREALAAMSPREAAVAAVDTLLAPGLWARSTVHACVYAINHAEPGADTTFSVAQRPIEAACWRPRDDVQASLLGPIALAFLATPLASPPADPLLAAFAALQALPLALDPLVALAEVAR
ncbi:hypothetical protein PM085_15795 [Halorubrum ezzemoulense]|uniref:Uncharacterized protein n=1 Tax=Halorubrum ezzemoulense TaxID=337243 RepID=A0ABT4Z6C9_HALEZ|nr:hypothetical protein [Halorubrum ezzemoulense]MDB2293720.1 hypothetical protein [Halorubrum ezzemoulense]